MPGLSGAEIALLVGGREAARRAKRTPFVFHSGADRAALARRVAETNALGAIPKGVSLDEWKALFQKLVTLLTSA
jgi:DNA-binding NarL/FixJ family response regulator